LSETGIVDVVAALEMLGAITMGEAQPIFKAAIQEIQRLRTIEVAVLACFEAEEGEEKREAWAKVREVALGE
jgi:hypothetical protein